MPDLLELMGRPVYVDIGEFWSSPIRTGIQRVVRQVIALWPSDVARVFARYDAAGDGLVEIPDALLDFLCRESALDGSSPERAAHHVALLDRARGARRIELRPGDRVLVPELFYEPERAAFYARLAGEGHIETFLTIHDFMPWLRPNLYRLGPEMSRIIMPYLRLTTLVRRRCFVSAATRDDFVRRIMRADDLDAGPVIALGSDGLDMPRQSFDPSKTDFLCIGTLEGKKHQEIVFQAFLSLPRPRPRPGRLRFLGRVPRDLAPWLRELVNYQGDDVEVMDGPSDRAMREHVARARASFFVSTSEGFGLPAVETLHCGLPTVIHAGLPALAGRPALGQIRLPEVTPAAVAAAMARLDDDNEAARLWRDAATLTLPSWRDFASDLVRWVCSGPIGGRS